MDLSDFFGPNDARPTHPDFWRISEQVLALDAAIDEASTPEAKQAAWKGLTGDIVDERSLSYMAVQRAMRALGIRTREQLKEQHQAVAMLSSIHIDGFVLGATYQRAGGHRDGA